MDKVLDNLQSVFQISNQMKVVILAELMFEL